MAESMAYFYQQFDLFTDEPFLKDPSIVEVKGTSIRDTLSRLPTPQFGVYWVLVRKAYYDERGRVEVCVPAVEPEDEQTIGRQLPRDSGGSGQDVVRRVEAATSPTSWV